MNTDGDHDEDTLAETVKKEEAKEWQLNEEKFQSLEDRLTRIEQMNTTLLERLKEPPASSPPEPEPKPEPPAEASATAVQAETLVIQKPPAEEPKPSRKSKRRRRLGLKRGKM
jgi:hypothetical protein